MPLLRKFIAGAGLLMFGLYLFEEAIKSLGGRKLKRILEAQTKTLRRGIRAGTRVSALTTSSTFVSLLLVAFVGAGLLTLHNAIGVVLGANIGTTLNSLWVAYIGFGEFKIAKYALPLIGIGGIIHMITKKKYRLDIAHICIGIGLLFLGLDYMKSSVELTAHSFNLVHYQNLRTFGGVGFLVTMLLHSGAAMQVITLAALSGGIITLGPAFAIIIGANVGTTMTALTASLGGSRTHKQVALVHFFQNLAAAGIGILFFQQFQRLCAERLADKLGYTGNAVLATAWFNTIFNVATAIPFLFLVKPFTKFIERITPANNTLATHHFLIEKSRGIGPVTYTIGVQLDALLKDCLLMHTQLKQYIYALIDKAETDEGLQKQRFTDEDRLNLYHQFKDNISFLYASLLPLQEAALTSSDVKKMNKIQSLLQAYTDTAKSYKNIATNLQELQRAKKDSFMSLYNAILGQIEVCTLMQKDAPPIAYGLHDLFAEAIQAASDEKSEIDIATLISTQHGLAQAYEQYAHTVTLIP